MVVSIIPPVGWKWHGDGKSEFPLSQFSGWGGRPYHLLSASKPQNLAVMPPDWPDKPSSPRIVVFWTVGQPTLARNRHRGDYSRQVLGLYLKRPRTKSRELRRFVGALQIQRLEGSRPGTLWDLFLDEAVVVVCKVALAVGALPFHLLVAERMVVGRHVGESGAHHNTTY